MERSKSFKIDDYFDVTADKSKTKCKFTGCDATFKGCNVFNLKRHVKTAHNVIFCKSPLTTGIKKQKKLVKIFMDADTFYKACITMVTKDALPIRTLKSKGLGLFIDPIGKALGVSMNSQNLVCKLKLAAANIKLLIAQELSYRMFSLKFDTATRLGRSFLGINAQFMVNDTIQVRTLAMIELTQRHTSEYLKCKLCQHNF